MTDSVRFRKLSCFKNIISFFISVAALAAVVLTVLPVASAAPSRIKSPLLEPVPSVVDNGDGTKTYTFYVLEWSEGYSDSALWVNVVTTSSANQLVFRIGQQNTVVNGVSQDGSNISSYYSVSTGSVYSAGSFTPVDLGAYFHVNNANYTFRFKYGYFPKQSAGSSNCYIHAWCPEGVTFVNSAGAYYVDDWVEWSVNPAENIYYSHLDRPVQDTFNRYFIAYNRKSKDGVLIHFNVALSGIFSSMFDAALSLPNISGEGDIESANSFLQLTGFYDSTGQGYQGDLTPYANDEITFTLTAANGGSISGDLFQMIDGSSFTPQLDYSSGSEVWKIYQPSIIYSNYGDVVCHYQIICGIYNLLDGSLLNQYVFDSVLNNTNQVILDIGSPLTSLKPTHILTFGTSYLPDINNGFNWGSVQWSVDPVVLQWRSDVISNIQQIRDLLQQQIGEDATQLNQSAVDSFHQAEDALQVKDGNGQPIDVAAQAEEQFDGALDGVRSLSGAGGAFQFLNTSIGEIFTDPLLVLPVIVALALGVAITILGKNKSE